jgi:F0F1-type ATP synthase assembly protein I
MPEPTKPSPESFERSDAAAARVSSQSLATSVTAYLISGPVVFGGAGRGLDNWLGTGFFTVIGLLVGMALSLYVIWLRYGTE